MHKFFLCFRGSPLGAPTPAFNFGLSASARDFIKMTRSFALNYRLFVATGDSALVVGLLINADCN